MIRLKRLLSSLFIFIVLLSACSDENIGEGATPEEAVYDLTGFVDEVINIYDLTNISEYRKISIFKARFQEEEPFFIADIRKDSSNKWFVNEAIEIGEPSKENLTKETEGNNVGGGFTIEDVDVIESEYEYIVKIEEIELDVWINFK